MKKSKANADLIAETEALMTSYYALSQGKKLINIREMLRVAGLNADRLPNIAVCRADTRRCSFGFRDGVAYFQREETWWSDNSRSSRVYLPRDLWASWQERDAIGAKGRRTAILPIIPPRYMPPDLSKYYLMWDAKWLPVAPADPVLLKRLSPLMFAVVAQWDLTPLERSIMEMRF